MIQRSLVYISGPLNICEPIWINLKVITIARLFKYIKNFTTKTWKFSDKNSDIFHISA